MSENINTFTHKRIYEDRRSFLIRLGRFSFGAASLFIPGCKRLTAKKELTSASSAVKMLAKRPNFVFIIIDDLGWKDVGFMSAGRHPFYETPNIDKLAGQGVIFTNAYANAPNCAPTRACLMSGQYTPRHGIYTVGSSERGKARFRKLIPIPNKTHLNPETVTIAEALKSAGYKTACLGKWHLGNKHPFLPEDQGFDVTLRRTRRSHFTPDGHYLTYFLAMMATEFIQANKDKPFFLYLSHHAVHTPIQAKDGIIEKYKAKLEKLKIGNRKSQIVNHKSQIKWNPTYAAMIESVDHSVAMIMQKLNQLGLADNTVIFFFSDNGGYGPVTSMAPLRGAKGMLYEGGIRVPVFIAGCFADRRPVEMLDTRENRASSIENRVCDVPVIGIDFYPTILEMAGVPKPAGHILDGQSLVPLLVAGCPRIDTRENRASLVRRSFGEGGSIEHRVSSIENRPIFWHFPAYLQAYSGGVSEGPWRTTPASAIRQGDWKLIEFFEDGKLELYNLKDDISEKNNLAQRMPEKTRQMHQLLIDWRKSINAPIPTERNPRYNPNI
jgi:arylsulfatase A-like enzyme